jgi:hypothetical protein
MKNTRRRNLKKSRKSNKKKGGDCGCNKSKSVLPDQILLPQFGGYGAASYQGGINQYINPLNTQISTKIDPSDSGNALTERFTKFSGGKKRRRMTKKRGGFRMDWLLGESGSTNPVLGAASSAGSLDMASKITGKP